MTRLFRFKSIYGKFTFVFLCVWWIIHTCTFGAIFNVLSNHNSETIRDIVREYPEAFLRIKRYTTFTFILSAILGTIVILYVVKKMVKPIKELSAASKEIAKGNFDVMVEPKCCDEIGMLTQDFNTMARELRSIDHMRKDFVSNVSHEFRTPITSIEGFAKLIRDSEMTSSEIMEYCNIIISESERLTNLSTNLLRLSELDSKIIRENSINFSLAEQVRKTILMLESKWSSKNISFNLNLEEVDYFGEEQLLQQVWINLISNAIKFSYEGGTIEINLKAGNGYIFAEVMDNGIGIPPSETSRIFERFYKSDKSRSEEGNGLGLAIVKKIINLSGGNVYCQSQPGKGSKFVVELKI